MGRPVCVLPICSCAAPFTVGRGEDIGSAMMICALGVCKRMYKQRRRVREVEEGGQRGNESGMPTILGGKAMGMGRQQQAVKRFQPATGLLPLACPCRGHMISRNGLAIGSCLQHGQHIRAQSPCSPSQSSTFCIHRRNSRLSIVQARFSLLERNQANPPSIDTGRERPARMSTSILASLAPSTLVLVNVGAALFLIAVALFGMSYRETRTSCEYTRLPGLRNLPAFVYIC